MSLERPGQRPLVEVPRETATRLPLLSTSSVLGDSALEAIITSTTAGSLMAAAVKMPVPSGVASSISSALPPHRLTHLAVIRADWPVSLHK